jgi:hypothetical protein
MFVIDGELHCTVGVTTIPESELAAGRAEVDGWLAEKQ